MCADGVRFSPAVQEDVIIDIVCYRRHGHNEGDDPTYTQPLMYQKIKKQPTVLTQYAQRLVREKVLTQAEVDEREKALLARLSEAYDLAKKNAEASNCRNAPADSAGRGSATAISRESGRTSYPRPHDYPADFHLHPKLKGFMDKRREVAVRRLRWIGPLAKRWRSAACLLEGTPVRLSGQDVGRGTFSQRHSGVVRRGERPQVRSRCTSGPGSGAVRGLGQLAERVRRDGL